MTAVEWLIKQTESLFTIETFQKWQSLKEQAKAMEKEQIEDAFQAGELGAISGWVDVTKRLPKPLQTVWLTNGKGWCCLGCLVEDAEGSHWAESNGVIYIENGEIVSECESDDLDVNYWHELPKPPCH